jgi:hypothetical protein
LPWRKSANSLSYSNAPDVRAHDYEIMRGGIQEAHLMVLQGLDEEGLLPLYSFGPHLPQSPSVSTANQILIHILISWQVIP